MSILILILIVIAVIVLLIASLIGFICIFAKAIGYRNEAIGNAWAYWEEKKLNRWDELSEDEKDKILQAYLIIEDDCGGCDSIEKIKGLMMEQLPILEPNMGMSHSMSKDSADI